MHGYVPDEIVRFRVVGVGVSDEEDVFDPHGEVGVVQPLSYPFRSFVGRVSNLVLVSSRSVHEVVASRNTVDGVRIVFCDNDDRVSEVLLVEAEIDQRATRRIYVVSGDDGVVRVALHFLVVSQSLVQGLGVPAQCLVIVQEHVLCQRIEGVVPEQLLRVHLLEVVVVPLEADLHNDLFSQHDLGRHRVVAERVIDRRSHLPLPHLAAVDHAAILGRLKGVFLVDQDVASIHDLLAYPPFGYLPPELVFELLLLIQEEGRGRSDVVLPRELPLGEIHRLDRQGTGDRLGGEGDVVDLIGQRRVSR